MLNYLSEKGSDLKNALVAGTAAAGLLMATPKVADAQIVSDSSLKVRNELADTGVNSCYLTYRGREFQLQLRGNILHILSTTQEKIEATRIGILERNALEGMCVTTHPHPESFTSIHSEELPDELVGDLKSKFGLNVVYDKCPSIIGHTWDKASDLSVTAAASTIRRFLVVIEGKLDPTRQLQNLCIVSNIVRDGVASANGVHDGTTIVVEAETTDVATVAHEFMHHFDALDGLLTDNLAWNKLNTKSHGYGPHAGDYKQCMVEAGPAEPAGYARSYGQNCGPDEDQATIAEDLFMGARAQQLIHRAINGDVVLANKIEMMTGCHLDANGGFTDVFTPAEYARKFHTAPQYYLKWSAGKMDAKYWNKVVQSSIR